MQGYVKERGMEHEVCVVYVCVCVCVYEWACELKLEQLEEA